MPERGAARAGDRRGPQSPPRARALAADVLRRTLDPSTLGFATTADVEPLEGMISQPRAGDALSLAVELREPGYNVFATGPRGVGKRSVLESELRRLATARPSPPDWVYLRDFKAPNRPTALPLPGGRGPELGGDVTRLIGDARRALAAAFESDSYRERRRALHEQLDRQRLQQVEALKAAGARQQVGVELTPGGIATMPLDAGRPLTREAFQELPAERQAGYQQALIALQPTMDDTFARLAELEREASRSHARLRRDVALAAIAGPVGELKQGYDDVERLGKWFDALLDDLLDHLDLLHDGSPSLGAPPGPARPDGSLERWAVHAFVTRAPGAGAPVIALHDCSYYELFGRIDYDTAFGAAITDHRHLRAGAVHEASGGYLVLEATDVLAKPFVWSRLKEVLRTGRARIENLGTQYMLFPTASLDPEPIDVDLTVVLVGSTELYGLLQALDADVPRLFKVRADFDPTAAWDDTGVDGYAAFVSRQVIDRGLPHFDREAVARVVEHGARIAGDRERLSTRYPEIGDLVLEAAHQARRAGAVTVAREHVESALEHRRRRSDLPEQRLRTHTLEGTRQIDVAGSAIGQVNGLAVVDLGDHRFGHPMRVSATVAPGEGDLVDIDREADLSGPIHAKGVLILAGLLRHLYCHSKPLALRASLVFEQSYGPVEGDSASAAELFAVLSALAGVPIDQRIAVTGSVDQRGRVQAIGGVNEKIEGFFALCRDSGLDRHQGVAIPAANVRHLMLSPEVVAAVRSGTFHVWSIATIDEGIELLTGTGAEAFHGLAMRRIGEFEALAQAPMRDLASALRGPRRPPVRWPPGNRDGQG